MTEAAPTKTKKQQRIDNAQMMILEYDDEEGSLDIVNSIQCRAHVARVLEALGLDNGLGYLADAVDKRVSCGLEPLPVLELALDGTLVQRIAQSKTEIAETTLANAEAARLDKLKREQAGGGRDRRNGPVRM
jgi:hypothetical protein